MVFFSEDKHCIFLASVGISKIFVISKKKYFERGNFFEHLQNTKHCPNYSIFQTIKKLFWKM